MFEKNSDDKRCHLKLPRKGINMDIEQSDGFGGRVSRIESNRLSVLPLSRQTFYSRVFDRPARGMIRPARGTKRSNQAYFPQWRLCASCHSHLINGIVFKGRHATKISFYEQTVPFDWFGVGII
jgi:hypothetical protein